MAINWKSATAEKRILMLMDHQGISETQLAKASGISQSTVHRIVAAPTRGHLTVERLERIAPLLGLTAAQLLDPEVPAPWVSG